MSTIVSSHARHWRTAAAALEVVRRRQQPTRRELAAELGLASGAASDLVGRLRAARLVAERRAEAQGPGRPTTRLYGHPDGPLVLAVDLRHGDWRLAACGVDGEAELLASERHGGHGASGVIGRLRTAVSGAVESLGARVLAVGVAVPGLVAGTRLLDAAVLGWRDVELSAIAGGLPLIADNDATMAAVAAAREHPSAAALLHLVLEIGIGGALVVDGRHVPGARGLAGEVGHMPFGDPTQLCGCGARGCWGGLFDPARVAARLGEPEPADARAWLRGLFDRPRPSEGERRACADLAEHLGRGTAGLVNALDPDVITLGGLAGPLLSAAPGVFERAFEAGLMDVHRAAPPQVVAGEAAENAALVGAALTAFDEVLDAQQLARWVTEAR